MKPNCIIDTNSCVYLSRAQFRQKPLIEYLNKVAHLYYSKEVNLEIEDHLELGIVPFIRKRSHIKLPTKFSIDEYETRLLGHTLPTRVQHGNKGEVDNFVTAIDQAHHHAKNRSTIFITDDGRAIRGILAGWIEAFPTVKYWTSYDVVLFLYAENIIPSKDIAKEVLREIFSETAPKSIILGTDEGLKENTMKKYQGLIKDYTDRIEKISQLLN